MRFYSKLLIFLALFALSFAVAPSFARADHCGAPFQTNGGYFFDEFESVEYINGLLAVHFKLKTPYNDGRAWYSDMAFSSDECGNGSTQYLRKQVAIPAGVRYFSFRFTSPTHFEIWDDEAGAPIPLAACIDCAQDVPALPGYYEISFYGLIDGGASTFSSSANRISQNAPDPPVRDNTLPAPPNCQPFQATGFFFDSYERAEYVNGLLNYHFRLQTPYNDGRAWISALRLHDENCLEIWRITPRDDFNTSLTPFIRYYSVRFSSPTHYDIWNDETNTMEICPACSVDIPALLPGPTVYKYVSFAGLEERGFGRFLNATPFPIVEEAAPACCSNVAFLPGLQASRLYKKQFFENQLWEPNRNADVEQLYLSSTTSESLDPDIYTRDVIGTAYGLTNIYSSFTAFMDDLKANGTIHDWEALPYDWRLDLDNILASGRKTGDNISYLEATSTPFILQELRHLAETSATGKVTIITHSNGGLLAKYLLKKLEDESDPLLGKIDKFIMVAAPQLGTPKAIFEMLHGAEPFFLGFPSKEVTREFAENMKSAYTLLPSRTYFDRLRDPLTRPPVEFSTTTPATQSFRNIYGNSISDYDTLRRFLRGENGARIEPQASAVNEPNVLKENFLTNAETRHAELDTWTPPLVGIDVVEIIGWGLMTPRGVRYESVKKKVCNTDLSVCSKIDVIDPQPLETTEGDGTVVYPSTEALGGERYYVDINKYNFSGLFSSTVNRDHKSILEIEPIQDLITTLIKNEATSTLPSFVTSVKPLETDDDKRLAVGVHSPVLLHLYDLLGRHTGLISNPNPLSDLEFFEEQIPNSYYWQVGEGQYAGADGATTTMIKLEGTDLGTFTIDIENIVGGVTATTTVYEDIPVAASTTATLIVGDGTSTPLLLDIDGDGNTDARITAGGLTAENLVGILNGLVKTLNLPAEKEKKLIKKIEKLEKELAKESQNERKEKRKTEHAFEDIVKVVKKYAKKRILSPDEANELISIIEQIKEKVI